MEKGKKETASLEEKGVTMLKVNLNQSKRDQVVWQKKKGIQIQIKERRTLMALGVHQYP
jgi:hypothetical protein